jgi:hypothetical protein
MAMLIDCDTCAGAGHACGDCVVRVLLTRPGRPVDIDPDEQRAIDVLAEAGLVPRMRLVPVSSRTA